MTKTQELMENLFQILFRNSETVPSDGRINNMVSKVLEACKKAGLAFVVEDEDSPKNPYTEDIFPATEKQVAELLISKGLSSDERTAIAGCLCRLGYRNALIAIDDAGWEKTEEIEVL